MQLHNSMTLSVCFNIHYSLKWVNWYKMWFCLKYIRFSLVFWRHGKGESKGISSRLCLLQLWRSSFFHFDIREQFVWLFFWLKRRNSKWNSIALFLTCACKTTEVWRRPKYVCWRTIFTWVPQQQNIEDLVHYSHWRKWLVEHRCLKGILCPALSLKLLMKIT